MASKPKSSKSKSKPSSEHIEKVSQIQKAMMQLAADLGPEAEEIAETVRHFRHKIRNGMEEIIKSADAIGYKISTKKKSKGGAQMVDADGSYVAKKTVSGRKKATDSKLRVLAEFDRVADELDMNDPVVASGTRAILKKKTWTNTEVDQLLAGTEGHPAWKKYRELVKASLVEDAPTVNYSMCRRNEDGKDELIDVSGHDYLDYAAN